MIRRRPNATDSHELTSPAPSPGDAVEGADDAKLQAICQHALELLAQGDSPSTVQQSLQELGLDAETAESLVIQLQLHQVEAAAQSTAGSNVAAATTVVGALVTVAGGLLLLGNLSGVFSTFPFAGFLTMLLGGAFSGENTNRQFAPWMTGWRRLLMLPANRRQWIEPPC